MDAIVLLKNDHRTVEKLFKEFQKKKENGSPAQKKRIVDEILRDHVEEEGNDWFPEVRKAMGRKRLVQLGARMAAAKADAPADPLALRSTAA